MKSNKFGKALAATGVAACMAMAGTAFAAPAIAADVSPKNVIVLIGDGMGYNHLDLMNASNTGETYWQVQRGGDQKVILSGENAAPTGWQAWDHVGQSTHSANSNAYDSNASWTDFSWNAASATDSAAAGTAMATGVKTNNGMLGFDPENNELENLTQRAEQLDKSTGVVSSVPYSHATPAAYSSHNENRNAYGEIANEQIYGDLEVVFGVAHPHYDNDGQPRENGNFTYINEADWEAVSNGETDRTFIETTEDFEALTTGETPETVFGTPQVGDTLQQGRSEGAPMNDVVDLKTMTEGALNVLDNNDNGFFLMVEGGAIDWAGHANQTDRDLEELQDFDQTVDAVIDWVETNSNWDDTLVVITADHETGYLYGETEGDYSSMVPNAEAAGGSLHTWNSGDHTNQLVPFFYKGAGSEVIASMAAANNDRVRGDYLDNTDMAAWLLDEAWVVPAEGGNDDEEPTETDDNSATDPVDTEDPADTEEPTETDDATSPTTDKDGDKNGNKGNGTSTDADKGDKLAQTGADAFLPIGIAAGTLLLAGAGFALKGWRKAAAE
ncbi:alkaline phosphatase [Gulosibacter chungangensis]|uniref:alkaline phosphatase n=1 Tax=Gulosibacter chungangensis TaxID=979746 RepID=UPI0017882921|nr:alkaline phosphatase [Gulosibacter chungangensis]